ncbi:hypothetical protein PSTT_08425 [Puccinia striiformis]|uniref:MULE transposase domain-containing protein n=1 Tax=Puccinia striiformis TaxID=27350 RepID=A0A2S4VCK0_9BASI|nr:hypothetical protein PSTT_08425 [Puccinia striiformis]
MTHIQDELIQDALLHIAGINSSNKTFTFAFAFISREKEGNFTWALDQLRLALSLHVPQVILTDKEQALMNAIEVIFPTARHLLCQWHMAKNLYNHCRPILGEPAYSEFKKAWNFVLVSNSPKSYQKNYANLALQCTPEVMDYMTTNWIPLKDKFFRYLISDIYHFNTSRVKSLYASVKRFLKGSNFAHADNHFKHA